VTAKLCKKRTGVNALKESRTKGVVDADCRIDDLAKQLTCFHCPGEPDYSAAGPSKSATAIGISGNASAATNSPRCSVSAVL